MTQTSVPGLALTRGMRRLQERRGIDLEEYLRREYEERKRTQTEIAEELGVDNATVSRWMARLGIETRLFASERAS
jgi:DNA-binding MarR family transcriptional regulator